MDDRLIYLTNPANLVSLVIFIFGLGATRSSLNGRLKECEKRLDRVDELDLDSRLTRMETILEYIRTTLEKLERLHK